MAPGLVPSWNQTTSGSFRTTNSQAPLLDAEFRFGLRMKVIHQSFAHVLNGGVDAPAELIGIGLPVRRTGCSGAVKPMALAHSLVIDRDLVVMRQRTARGEIRRLRQGRRDTGEPFPEGRHGVVFLRVTA